MSKKNRPVRTYPPLPKEIVERVDQAWDALEDGDIETAGLEAEEMMEQTDEHPEIRFLFGAALLESGAHQDALDSLLRRSGDDLRCIASILPPRLQNLRLDEAIAMFREVIEAESDAAPPGAGCFDFLGATPRRRRP
ncbi:MAG: hypothetical protein U0527_15225 [Candidatus Eisenbacteria bacterium]